MHKSLCLVLLAASCLFQSCSNSASASQAAFKETVERRNKYAESSASHPVDFSKFFTEKKLHGVKLQTVEVGKLNIVSGKIVASDPFYVSEPFTAPFAKKVKPGRYPVILVLADLKDWGRRVAFAQLKLSDAAPVKWEPAKWEEKSAEENFYPVDAGLGCFADVEAARALAKAIADFYAKHPKGNYYDDVMAADFKGHDDWANHHPTKGDLNVIIFSSGVGDGGYSSYWGLDAKGNVVALVTDFQLFDYEGSIDR